MAEGGIPVDFAHNLTYVNGSQDWSGVIPAVLVGVGRGFGINIRPYLSPDGVQITNTVSSQCINNFLGNYPGLTVQKLLKPQYQDFLGIPVFADTINHLIMSRTGTPKGPLFIGVGNKDGTGDGVMIANDDEALAHTYCQRGVSVQFNTYSGQDHDNAAVPFEAGAFGFLTARLTGVPVPNGCSSIGAGNSLAPVPVPAQPGTKAAKPKPTPKLRFHLRRRQAQPARRGHPAVDDHGHPDQAHRRAAPRRQGGRHRAPGTRGHPQAARRAPGQTRCPSPAATRWWSPVVARRWTGTTSGCAELLCAIFLTMLEKSRAPRS